MNKSMTALLSAFVRAYHAEQEGEKVFDDGASKKMLGEDYEIIARHMARAASFFDPDFSGMEQERLRMTVMQKLAALPLARSVFAESALKTEIDIGTRQYVILGAGYDTFIYRRPYWASDVHVFLVDRAEILTDRRRRAEAAGLKAKGEYTEIPADFSQQSWIDRLTGNEAFSARKRTFVSMLGVSCYLERETMAALLTSLGETLPEGSALAFDYMDAGGSEDMSRQGMLARAAGKPMHQGYDYDSLEALLSRSGFLIYEHATPQEMDRRFFEAYNRIRGEQFQLKAMEGVNCCLAVRKRRR